MKFSRRPSFVSVAIIAYCAWQSAGILGAWKSDPQNFLGWLALLLWISPTFYLCTKSPPDSHAMNFILLCLALAFSFFGTLGSVNAFHYFGFACAVAGAGAWLWKLLPWLAGSISWMPVFGYLGSKFLPQQLIMPARLFLALVVAGWTWNVILRHSRRPA